MSDLAMQNSKRKKDPTPKVLKKKKKSAWNSAKKKLAAMTSPQPLGSQPSSSSSLLSHFSLPELPSNQTPSSSDDDSGVDSADSADPTPASIRQSNSSTSNFSLSNLVSLLTPKKELVGTFSPEKKTGRDGRDEPENFYSQSVSSTNSIPSNQPASSPLASSRKLVFSPSMPKALQDMEGSLSENHAAQTGYYPLQRSSTSSKLITPVVKDEDIKKPEAKSLDIKTDLDTTRCRICTERMDIPPGRRAPKVLRCMHSFCQVCLEKVWQLNNQSEVVCPLCRTATPIGKETGLSGLTNDFNVIRALDLNNLLTDRTFCDECNENRGARALYRCLECKLYLCDIHCTAHKLGKRTFGHPLLTIDEAKRSQEAQVALGTRPMCKVQGHERQETTLYCETCDKVICLACTLVDHVRPEHKYDFASKAVKPGKEQIVEVLNQSKALHSKLSLVLSAVTDTQKRVHLRDGELQEAVRKAFDILRQELNAREEAMCAELDALTIRKEGILAHQEKELIFELNKLRSATDFTDLMLKVGSSADVLRVKTQIMKRLDHLKELQIDGEPRTNQRMSWGIDMSSMTSQILHIGWLRDSTLLVGQCYAQGEGLQKAYYGREASFNVVTVDKDMRQVREGGEVLQVNLYDEKGENRLVRAASVKDNSDGTYAVRYEPRMGVTSAKCQLHVSLRGNHVKDSPFQVFVQH